jgi:hypothetical protein
MAAALATASFASNEVIDFHTGNGGGSQDSVFTFVAAGSSYAPWSGLGSNSALPTLTSSDFSAAAAGQNAYILSGLAGGWVNGLPSDASAKWIGDQATGWNNSYGSYSALYAMPFTLTSSAKDAVLTITFSVDDQFGDSSNEGLFIDGAGIANSVSTTDWNNQIETKTYDLGALGKGVHDIYFDVYNSGAGPSGMIATGNITASNVPGPASIAVFAVGAFSAMRRRKK